MHDTNSTSRRWSDELAQAILVSISDDQLETILGRGAIESSVGHVGSPSDARAELIARSLTEPAVRAALRQAWRNLHSDVVAAAQFIAIDGPAEQCEGLVLQFGVENILLELITDDADDDWAVVEWTVENVKSDRVRRELAARLDRWKRGNESGDRQATDEAALRIVIFGGHPRDESKMNRRLFENSNLDVRWKPCAKNQGSPDDKDLNAAMGHADAVILITSMVSHNIMRIVKRFTQKRGIPLRMVAKATDQQFRSALADLFPDHTLPNE